MKITVCGKGGCGKSTVTTLLAKELARMGKKVLVVDSDESNFGLHRQLGVELPRDFTEYFGGKDCQHTESKSNMESGKRGTHETSSKLCSENGSGDQMPNLPKRAAPQCR